MIAIIFNFILSKSFFRDKKTIILSIALLTTLSTSGYLAFGFLIISYFLLNKKPKKALIYLPIIILISYLSYTNINFLGEKINKEISYFHSGNPNTLRRERLVSAYLDIKDVIKNPILGHGLAQPDYSYAEKKWINHRNNGVTELAAKFGIILFFIYFFSILKSIKTFCFINNKKTSFALVALIIILIIGFSENYFTKPLFLSLIFLNFVYFESFLPRKFINVVRAYFLIERFKIFNRNDSN